MPESPLNVLIIGETGVGKSSVVNLIAGEVRAEVSPDCDVCTTKTTRYDITIGSMSLHVWEIVGFNQPRDPTDNEIPVPDVDLGSILADDKATAVDVVLFCMRAERVREITKKFFNFVKDMFGDQVPIVLVINHWAKRDMEDWWRQNEEPLRTKRGIEGDEHVCVTGIGGNPKHEQSQGALLAELRDRYEARGNKTLESIFLTYLGKLDNKELKETLGKLHLTTAQGLMEELAALSPTNGRTSLLRRLFSSFFSS